ncbi:MAG: hypothetical protein Q8S35_00080 [bacterium]|nr:hypothetical protein [bacterium]
MPAISAICQFDELRLGEQSSQITNSLSVPVRASNFTASVMSSQNDYTQKLTVVTFMHTELFLRFSRLTLHAQRAFIEAVGREVLRVKEKNAEIEPAFEVEIPFGAAGKTRRMSVQHRYNQRIGGQRHSYETSYLTLGLV